MRHVSVALRVAILFLLTASCLMAGPADVARQTVQHEIDSALRSGSRFAEAIGRNCDFARELRQVLGRAPALATAKPVVVEGRTVKFLVPLVLDAQTVGGFFQVSADGRTLLSYLPWDGNLHPLFTVSRAAWDKAATANDLPDLAELVPLKTDTSAGTPVEPGDVENLFLIDGLAGMPCKTQEERRTFTELNDLKGALGRRTGSSKCLSYSASLASDWWKIILGRPIGKYDSFVNGAREYGLNPRLLESLYFATETSPYSFMKLAGKDRVTGEKIPYSPKHFAFIMSWIPLPTTVKDPLRAGLVHSLPRDGFGMDRPFHTVFNKSKGKVAEVRQALERFGILYAQHTSRLFHDKLPLSLQGVHAVNIVGTGRLKGQDVILYYETFGNNHRDYLEDSFYGPRLRAFPIGFFYQANAFPHQIRVALKPKGERWEARFTDHLGHPCPPQRLEATLDGKPVLVQAAAKISLPAAVGVHELRLRFGRRFFATPEEPDGYERFWLVEGNRAIELGEYRAVVKGLAWAHKEARGFLGLGEKRNSTVDDLTQREEKLRNALTVTLRDVAQRNGALFAKVQAAVAADPIWRESPLGRDILTMAKFREVSDRHR